MKKQINLSDKTHRLLKLRARRLGLEIEELADSFLREALKLNGGDKKDE